MEIKVIDNFLSSVFVDKVELLITNSMLPLFYNVNTLGGPDLHGKGKETSQFTHNFLKDGQFSSYMPHIEPIIFNFIARTEVLQSKGLSRCKLNLNCKDTSYKKDEHFPAHIDHDVSIKGITAIYYVNNADGDTLFFDNNYKIVESITPKKGRIVYFDNKILHAGQPPQQSLYRAVINFNWIERGE